jgi:membrane protein YqaA with SNARE-associated domain
MLNYWIGHLGRLEWIERYLHVPPDKVHSTQEWLNHGGAWMGVLAFIPLLGDVISVTLGFMRANVVLTAISIFLGKALRYAILIWAINMV